MADVTIWGNTTIAALGVGFALPTTFGRISSVNCGTKDLEVKTDPGGAALLINPFYFTLPCPSSEEGGCEFKTGDQIKMSTVSFFFIDITSVTYLLDACSGSKTFWGFCLGVGFSGFTWQVS
jgi:hypothetical protein